MYASSQFFVLNQKMIFAKLCMNIVLQHLVITGTQKWYVGAVK
jgi:hypothetical protein